MSSAPPCSNFLESVDLGDVQHIDVGEVPHIDGAPARELGALVEHLKCKQFAEALSLVRSGQVPVRTPFGWSGDSLLSRSMRRTFHRRPVVADVEALLDAVQSRGEVLDEQDFLAACATSTPALVQLLLNRGAPLSSDALHLLFRRGCFPANESIECARVLMGARAQLDALGSWSVTPLSVACTGIGNCRGKLVRWLLEERADPDGAGGKLPPLHALLSGLCLKANEVRFLVEARASVNKREPVYGCAPLHIVLSARCNVELAMELVALGADPSLADDEGVRPAQLLIRQGKPQAAADLERRAMNAEEVAMEEARRAAAQHPVAERFRRIFGRVPWVLRCKPELRATDDAAVADGEVAGSVDPAATLSSLLEVPSPKVVELELALTRYSELRENVAFAAPQPDGFTVQSLVRAIYEYYQEELSAAQIARIKKCSGLGLLGDVFGYIRRRVLSPDSDGEEESNKRQRSQRIDLRGDCVYFEGFCDCMYFESEGKLCGRMLLGS